MLSKYGIADMKKRADWVPARDPDIKKALCTGTPATQIYYFILKIYFQKFGRADNSKYSIVSAQLVSATRNVQKDSSGNSFFMIPFMVDWVEVDANVNVYTPPIPNLSDKFYLPDVSFPLSECSLPFLRCLL